MSQRHHRPARPRLRWLGRGAPVLLALLATAPAGADDTAFDHFHRSEDHLARAAAVALEADARMPPACAQRAIADRVSVERDGAVRFEPGSATPTDGLWRERWRIERCGETRAVNLHFVADRSGISVDIGVPGESLAALPDQQGAVAVLGSFTAAELAACEDLSVIDTTVVTPPAEGLAAWTERWTLVGCGGADDVLIRFHPDQAPSLFEIIRG